MDDEHNATAEPPELMRFPIVRDTTFVRISADAFMPWLLGSDIEVSLLAASPDVSGQFLRVLSDGEDMTARLNTGLVVPVPTYVEVGRLRVNIAAAQNIVTVMTTALVSNGLISRAEIDRVLDAAEAMKRESASTSQ